MRIMEKRKKRKHYGSCGSCSQFAVVCSGSADKPVLISKHTNYEKMANMRSCSNMKQNINLELPGVFIYLLVCFFYFFLFQKTKKELYKYFPFLCLPEEIKHRNCFKITLLLHFIFPYPKTTFVQFFLDI